MKPLTIMSDPFHHFIRKSNNRWVKKNKNREYSQKQSTKHSKLLKYLTKKNHPTKTTQQAKLRSQRMR